MSNRLADMTTHEAADAVRRGTTVLLPVGAFEQHGPGLPLATDIVRAEAVVERVADQLGDGVVVGPSVPVGVSPHHLAFAGTLSLRPATFVAVLHEYLQALAGHGWRRVLIVTGHGGNNAALGVLAQDVLRDLPDLELAWTPVTALAADHVGAMDVSEVHGHSGEAETAQMLHVAPDSVRRDLLEPGTTTLDELDPLSHLARTHGPPTLALPYDRLSKNGVLGDPRRATVDDGRAIIDLVTQRIVTFLAEWSTT
ncbi:creatininase family protein [Aeromicrobium sp. CF4.19]|uniref:creatininase family protein n=1 Tax=Aeromicrobium sp. CF4.19 TaxID=3373082 RepID=UPI003EE526F8